MSKFYKKEKIIFDCLVNDRLDMYKFVSNKNITTFLLNNTTPFFEEITGLRINIYNEMAGSIYSTT